MSNKISAEQALKLFWKTEEPDALSRHSARTDECFSFREFENHVMGKKLFGREQLEHVIQCPYCQTTRSLFGKHCGVSPFAIATETYARARAWMSDNFLLPQERHPEHLLAKGPPQPHHYDLAVINESGQPLVDGRVTVTQGPLVTPDGCLLMMASFDVPESLRDRFPLELALVSPVDEQIIVSLDLPGLEEQLLKVRIPEPLLAQARQMTEAQAALPFALVLRAGQATLLAQALAA